MAAAAKRRKRLETTLAAAVAHPIRSKALVILAEREASPAEIARLLDLDLSKMSYHVRALEDAKLIEETRTRPVRGAVEHFYRATTLPRIDNDQEAERSEDARRVYIETIWSIACANATLSLEDHDYLRRDDHHTTRFAFAVDEQGWGEAADAHLELEARIYEIQVEAARRMGQSDEKPIRAVSFQAFFEDLPPKAPDAE